MPQGRMAAGRSCGAHLATPRQFPMSVRPEVRPFYCFDEESCAVHARRSRRAIMSARVKDLKEAVVVITGASSGIGRATAYAFARCGATVVAAGRRADVLEDVA